MTLKRINYTSIYVLFFLIIVASPGMTGLDGSRAAKKLYQQDHTDLSHIEPLLGPMQSNNWTEKFPLEKPSSRFHHAMAYDSKHDRVILFGGFSNNSINDETWSYDYANNSWKNLNPISSPPPLIDHAMAYDSESDRVILFGGGQVPFASNETWAYDYQDNNWTNMNPIVKPSSRAEHAMVYDSLNDRVILFGGWNLGPCFKDTWAYDYNNNTWKNMTPPNPPSICLGHAMAYDSRYNVTILNGGDGTDYSYSYTWAYNYRTNVWKSMNAVYYPHARQYHKMAYDTQSDRVIMFGGKSVASTNETWAYDYENDIWANMRPQSSPSERTDSAMAYQSKNDSIILFGGEQGFQSFQDTWVYQLGVPPPVIIQTKPADGSIYVPLNSSIFLSFSEEMNTTSTEAAISSIPVISGSFTWNSAKRNVTWKPSADLGMDYDYKVTINTMAKSLKGINMTSAYRFSFHTAMRPSVINTYPANGAKDIPPKSYIMIDFDQEMDNDSVEKAIRSSPQIKGPYTWSNFGRSVTINPITSLQDGCRYNITINKTARSSIGLTIYSDYDFSFITSVSPRVVSTYPSNGSKNISIYAGIQVSFSMEMDRYDTWSAILFSPDIDESYSWDTSGQTITIHPKDHLKPSTKYNVTIGTQAKSRYNIAMREPFSFSFTTTSAPEVNVTSTNPTDGTTYVALTDPVSVTFDQYMDLQSTSAAFSISPNVDGGHIGINGKTLAWGHSSEFIPGARYTVTISNKAQSTLGGHLSNSFSFSFSTWHKDIPSSNPPSLQLGLINVIVIGALVGGLVFIVVWGTRRAMAKREPSSDIGRSQTKVPTEVIIGGAIGGAVGALIGHTIAQNRTRQSTASGHSIVETVFYTPDQIASIGERTESGTKLFIYGLVLGIISTIIFASGGYLDQYICFWMLIPISAYVIQLVGYYKIHSDRFVFGEAHTESVNISLIFFIVGIIGLVITRLSVNPVTSYVVQNSIQSGHFSFWDLLPTVFILDVLELVFISLIAAGTYFLFKEVESDSGLEKLRLALTATIVIQILLMVSDILLYSNAAPKLDQAMIARDSTMAEAILANMALDSALISLLTLISNALMIIAVVPVLRRISILRDLKMAKANEKTIEVIPSGPLSQSPLEDERIQD
jgi:hypothetical protein